MDNETLVTKLTQALKSLGADNAKEIGNGIGAERYDMGYHDALLDIARACDIEPNSVGIMDEWYD